MAFIPHTHTYTIQKSQNFKYLLHAKPRAGCSDRKNEHDLPLRVLHPGWDSDGNREGGETWDTFIDEGEKSWEEQGRKLERRSRGPYPPWPREGGQQDALGSGHRRPCRQQY